MKTRLTRAGNSEASDSSEVTGDWVIPIQEADSQQGSYELRPIDRPETTEAKPSWKSLFAFTSKAHLIFSVFSVSSPVLFGVLKPVSSIFFGKIFSVLAKLGSGTLGPKDASHQISLWCIGLTALGIAAWISGFALLSSWIIFGEVQAKCVRNKMFAALLDKDQEWYDMREDGIGSLLVRIQTQIRELQLAVSQPLGILLFELVASFASLGIALYSTWKLTLVMLATFPIVGGILFLVSRGLAPAVEAQKRELGKASKYASTAVSAIDTVKAFNGQNQEMWQYTCAVKKVTTYYLLQARSNAMQFGIIKFMIIGLFVQGFWFGVYLVNNGLDPGHVLTAFYACLSALQAAEVVLPQWLVLAKGMSAGETLKAIMRQMQSDWKSNKEAHLIKPDSCSGDIEIIDVSFAYPSNIQRLVLNNVSLFFPSGETTFVVGTSGSGKSTIGNLIMKYYKPLSGSILVDGNEIQTIDTDWIRQNITLVQQDSVLFNETIFRNISFGNRDRCGTEDVLEACKTASLMETIEEMPEGLDTLVGSGGRTLSGGQKQRVAIARARLRDAPILILDESTSALDHASRLQVMTQMREWRIGKTTIIITHDMSQILGDDYVYVLDHAIVVQEGYRKNLDSKLEGKFASMLLPRLTTEDLQCHETPGPTEAGHEKDFSHRWRPISGIFGVPGPTNSHLSWGYGITQANTARSSFVWSASPQAVLSPVENSRRQSHISFMSPATPRAPSPVLLVKDNNYVPSPVSSMSNREEEGFHDSLHLSLSTDTCIRTSEAPEGPRRPSEPTVREIITPYQNAQDDQQTTPVSLTKIFGTIWPTLTRKGRVIFVFGFFAAFVVGACTPTFAYLFARLLSVFYIPRNERARQALKWALSVLGIAIVDGLACFSMHYMLEYSAQSWITSLRLEALKRILAQPKVWFDDENNSPGRLSECLDRNAEEMRNLVGRFAGLIFTVFWMVSISVVCAFIISWQLTLVALASGPVVYVFTRAFHVVSSKWEDKCNKRADYASSIFTETFANIRVVRALTLENHFARKHRVATMDTYKTGVSRGIFCGSLFGATDAISFSIIALIFYYGTVLITSGSHSLNNIIQVVNLLLFAISNASNMLSMVPQISSSRATATTMLRLTNLPLDASHESHGTKRLASPLPIKMTNLSFSHSQQPHIKTLSKISLQINAGSCTAIVGPSGSGKSTLLSILQCLYPPDPPPLLISPPALTFAGVAVQNCNVTNLRTHISIVPQTPLLFPSSILENITYGLPETSPFGSLSAAQRAAEKAGIHSFIMSLDAGYGTLIGDGGMGLSGGQAQRIAIARALVRQPKVLILDEATSALDGENAEGVRRVVRELISEGIAVVMVSHNIEMMRLADMVVVVEEGTVVERGGFEQLCRRRGALAKLIGIGG